MILDRAVIALEAPRGVRVRAQLRQLHDVAHAAPRIARITAAASAPDTRTLGLKR